jgi:hypothetical protein
MECGALSAAFFASLSSKKTEAADKAPQSK